MDARPRAARRRLAATLAAAAVAVPLSVSSPVGAATTTSAPTPAGAYGIGGTASAAEVTVASLVQSRALGQSALGCKTDVPASTKTDVAATDLGLAGRLGAGTTTVSASGTHAAPRQTSLARTGAVNLLGGLIRADMVTATSTTAPDGAGFSTAGSGTEVTNLVIAGRPYASAPGPNTRVVLPGLATVTLNETLVDGRAATATTPAYSRTRVIGLHVQVLANNPLGLPANTDIKVSVADGQLTSTPAGRVFGLAYGTQLTTGTVLHSGPTGAQWAGCYGTGGQQVTQDVAGVDLGRAGTVGAINTTQQATVSASESTVTMTSSTGAIRLLDGTIVIDGVSASAGATRTTAGVLTTTEDATVARATVNGTVYEGTPGANTRIDLPFGVLWLQRVVPSPGGVEVRAVQLEILEENPFDLPIGTDLRIGVAAAYVS